MPMNTEAEFDSFDGIHLRRYGARKAGKARKDAAAMARRRRLAIGGD